MVRLCVGAKRPHDVRDREEMNGRIEKGKRGALPRAVQRGPGRELAPMLDVAGGQRAQPARQLRSGEIGEMTSLERRDPCVDEMRVAGRFVHSSGLSGTISSTGWTSTFALRATADNLR